MIKVEIGRMIADLIANIEQIAKPTKISVPAIKFKNKRKLKKAGTGV